MQRSTLGNKTREAAIAWPQLDSAACGKTSVGAVSTTFCTPLKWWSLRVFFQFFNNGSGGGLYYCFTSAVTCQCFRKELLSAGLSRKGSSWGQQRAQDVTHRHRGLGGGVRTGGKLVYTDASVSSPATPEPERWLAPGKQTGQAVLLTTQAHTAVGEWAVLFLRQHVQSFGLIWHHLIWSCCDLEM